MQSSLGFAVASQWLRSVLTPTMWASLGFAVLSQCVHAVNAGLASASLRHHSVFTLAMQASLRLRSGIAASSCWQCRHRYGFAVSLQRLHARNAGLASASHYGTWLVRAKPSMLTPQPRAACRGLTMTASSKPCPAPLTRMMATAADV